MYCGKGRGRCYIDAVRCRSQLAGKATGDCNFNCLALRHLGDKKESIAFVHFSALHFFILLPFYLFFRPLDARWPSVYGIGIAVSFCNNQRQRNGAQTWLIVNCCSLNCYQWLVVFQLVASRKRKHRACIARMLEATWATIAAPSQQHHHIISYRPGTIEMPSTSRMGRNR